MFRVYDYTDVTRLFGQDFVSPPSRPSETGGPPPPPPPPTVWVDGFEVHVTEAGRFILAEVDGRTVPVTVEEYKQRLAARLVAEVPTLEKFRDRWIVRDERNGLLALLTEAGFSPLLVRAVDNREDFDLFDVLADLGYGLNPLTRFERAAAFGYKHSAWLAGLPSKTSATLRALASQFSRAGTDGLENPNVFQTPEVQRAGGLASLRDLGRPADVLLETKKRLFAA
jgi:type I restriction enzyme R subunit